MVESLHCFIRTFLLYMSKTRLTSAPKVVLRTGTASPGTIRAQFKPKQPHQKPISAHAGNHFNPWVQGSSR